MKLKYLTIFIILGLIATIGIRFVGFGSASEDTTGFPPWPKVSDKTSNEKDINAVRLVLEKSYTINSDGNIKGDASRYAEVYTNDPNVPLNAEQEQFVQTVKTTYKIHDVLMDQAGWLSFKLSQFIDLSNGREALNQKQSGKPETGLTVEDITGIPAVNVPNPIPLDKLPSITEITYKEIKIDDAVAWIHYDDGSAEAEAFLVKTDQGWKIAGIRSINIHF